MAYLMRQVGIVTTGVLSCRLLAVINGGSVFKNYTALCINKWPIIFSGNSGIFGHTGQQSNNLEAAGQLGCWAAALPNERLPSRCRSIHYVKFFSAARRVGFPAIAARTLPIKLARLEAAMAALIARQLLRISMHQMLDHR